METNEGRRRRGRGRSCIRCWLLPSVAFFASIASWAATPEAMPTLVDGTRLERRVPGDSQDHLLVDASAGALVVVIDQLGADLVLHCADEAHARNSPTGRWGPEVIVVGQRCELSVRARSAGTPTLVYRARAFALDSQEGRRLPRAAWEAWSQGHYEAGAEDAPGMTSALARLREAERAVARLGDSDELRFLRFGNAQLLRRTGMHADALVAYDAFMRGLEPARDAVWLARASNGKGLSLRALDRFEEADQAFADAERYGADRRDAYEWVSAKNNRCLILHHYGKLTAARDCYAAVIPHYREVAPNQLAVPMLNLAAAADALGEPAIALANYRAALEQRRSGTDRSSLGFVLFNLAGLEAQTGEWPNALEHSLEALQVFEALGDNARIAVTLHLRGLIYSDLRENKRAREYFKQASAVALDSKDLSLIAVTKSALAAMEPDDALAAVAHREAIEYLVQTRQAGLASREWMRLAERLDAMGKAEERDAALDACEALLQSNESRDYRSRVAMLRGRVALRDGRLAQAAEFAAQALVLRQQTHEIDGLAAARLLKARIERRSGQDAPALAGIERALDELQRAERLPNSPVLAASLYDRRIELLDEAADILLGSATPDAAAMGKAWLFKWKYARLPDAVAAPLYDAAERKLVDELRAKVMLLSGNQKPGLSGSTPPEQTPELQRDIEKRVDEIESQLDARRALAPGAVAPVLALPAVQAALQPDEALVSISLGARTSGAWVSTTQGTQWMALPNRADLLQSVEALAGRFDPAAHVALSQSFAGILAATKGRRRVLIVPDGPSHLIPFAALRDEAGYWIERSSLELLDGPPTQPSQLRPVALDSGFPVVVWGASEVATEADVLADGEPVRRSGIGLAELPAASLERRQIEQMLGARRVTAGDPRAVGTPAGAGRWMLHIVGHGVASKSHPYAAALALPEGNGDSGFAFTSGSLVQFGKQAPEIAFINVCEGYSGRLFDLQPPSSLARGFLQAGTKLVIAASWPIEDMRAARFAESVYEELDKHPFDAAEAVARAQRRALQAGGVRGLRHWSGYSVVRGR